MGKLILVVEDHPPTVKMITYLLSHEGYEVASASNGAECLLAIHSQRPDLVILDVIMPVMDGFQTLRILKENADLKDLPVIILTARKEDQDILQGLVGGADLYLTKPLHTESLLAAVKRLLSVRNDTMPKRLRKGS